jgi:hypothetical protein
MSRRKYRIPNVAEINRLGARKVRFFFDDGAVIDMVILWLFSKQKIQIIDQGAAVKFGSGPMASEVSSWALRERAGTVVFTAAGVGLFPGQVRGRPGDFGRGLAKRRGRPIVVDLTRSL